MWRTAGRTVSRWMWTFASVKRDTDRKVDNPASTKYSQWHLGPTANARSPHTVVCRLCTSISEADSIRLQCYCQSRRRNAEHRRPADNCMQAATAAYDGMQAAYDDMQPVYDHIQAAYHSKMQADCRLHISLVGRHLKMPHVCVA